MGPDRKWGNLLAWTVEVGLEAASEGLLFSVVFREVQSVWLLFFFFLLKNWSCAREMDYIDKFFVNKGKAFKDLLITQVKKKGNLGSRMKLRI